MRNYENAKAGSHYFNMEYQHTPVMLKEVLEYLDPQPGQNYIDCTLGGGSYTLAIAKRIMPGGKILSIDLDKLAITNAKKQIEKYQFNNIILANDNFKNLLQIVKKYFKTEQILQFSGIVFDLGLSSAELQDRDRGFSFQLAAPLDMNFSQTTNSRKQTTEYIINNFTQENIEKIIHEYGQEKFAKKIALEIVRYRKEKPIKTTNELVDIIKKAVPKKYQYSRLHPATRTFQALRIATNDELENLNKALPQTLNLLKKGGKLTVISYHSLEDKIVKQFFKLEARDCLCPPFYPICRCQHHSRLKILTPHVLRPTQSEVNSNPRARSARLRIAERI